MTGFSTEVCGTAYLWIVNVFDIPRTFFSPLSNLYEPQRFIYSANLSLKQKADENYSQASAKMPVACFAMDKVI